MSAVGVVVAAACALLWVARRNKTKPSEGGRQFVVRKGKTDEDWEAALPSVPKAAMKKRDLFTEPGSGRFALELVLSPNQKYPAHVHGSNEWCFLVQGDITDQFGTKHAGDFFYNEITSLHYGIQAGKDGCTILVVKDVGGNKPRPDLDTAT